jgi:hypothetical protein
MNKEEFAKLITGREYGNLLMQEEEKLAAENGLLICFGESDDLLEFRGIVNDETAAWEGTETNLCFKKEGKIGIIDDCDLKELIEFIENKNLAIQLPTTVAIKAEWSPSSLSCSWLITTELPSAPFDIMEDNELYCRGIVISENDIRAALNKE